MRRLYAAQPQALGSVLKFCTPKAAPVTLNQSAMQVEDLLNSIPMLFEGTQVQANCMAAATRAAVQTLKVRPCSGHASPTNVCPLPHHMCLPYL